MRQQFEVSAIVERLYRNDFPREDLAMPIGPSVSCRSKHMPRLQTARRYRIQLRNLIIARARIRTAARDRQAEHSAQLEQLVGAA